jgi:CDP-glycerol glycerophosphotransferase
MSETERAGRAPLMSIVLPVHGVEQHLDACLDSVLSRRPGDMGQWMGETGPLVGQADPLVEVIAVDDGSPDRCGEILAARARADARLRVERRVRSAGPGAARNVGLALARGDYVWFVDPDDVLPSGSLSAVARAITALHPDVLLLDYRTTSPGGRSETSPGPGLLAAPEPGPTPLTLADRPALIERTMTVWSKVFRRDYLTGLAVPFRGGIHEDVPVSCCALLAARSIVPLARVCYLYRRRPGSFLTTASMDHFAIFGSYDEVFAWLDRPGSSPRPPVGEPVRAALFARMIEHCTSILATGLVPPSARREYFERMVGCFHRYRPPGYRPPWGGPRAWKMALIERGAYRAYEVLAPLNGARVAVRRAALRHAGRWGK